MLPSSILNIASAGINLSNIGITKVSYDLAISSIVLSFVALISLFFAEGFGFSLIWIILLDIIYSLIITNEYTNPTETTGSTVFNLSISYIALILVFYIYTIYHNFRRGVKSF